MALPPSTACYLRIAAESRRNIDNIFLPARPARPVRRRTKRSSRNANLRDANLQGADLEEANLTNAEGLTREQLDEACGDDETKLPDYLADYQMKLPCPTPEQTPSN